MQQGCSAQCASCFNMHRAHASAACFGCCACLDLLLCLLSQGVIVLRLAWISLIHATCLLRLPQRLGVKKALVVHSMGLDELTPMGPADVVEVTQQGGCHAQWLFW